MISSIGASTNCDPSASGRGTPGRGGAIAAVTCQYGGGSARPRRIASLSDVSVCNVPGHPTPPGLRGQQFRKLWAGLCQQCLWACSGCPKIRRISVKKGKFSFYSLTNSLYPLYPLKKIRLNLLC